MEEDPKNGGRKRNPENDPRQPEKRGSGLGPNVAVGSFVF